MLSQLSYAPVCRLRQVIAATKCIIHQWRRFVNGFFEILQTFIFSLQKFLILLKKTEEEKCGKDVKKPERTIFRSAPVTYILFYARGSATRQGPRPHGFAQIFSNSDQLMIEAVSAS